MFNFNFITLLLFMSSLTINSAKTNSSKITFVGCVVEYTDYTERVSSCGVFSKAGVFKFIVTESDKEELIGKELLVMIGCSSRNKKGCKYRVVADKDRNRYDNYLIFNNYKHLSLPNYSAKTIDIVSKCKRCNKVRKRRKRCPSSGLSIQ